MQIADASQIWGVLIATGIAAGTMAAFIDVAADWLGDIKAGVCGNVETGGKFYLNKGFCCWGVDGEVVVDLLDLTDSASTRELQRLEAVERSIQCHFRGRKLPL